VQTIARPIPSFAQALIPAGHGAQKHDVRACDVRHVRYRTGLTWGRIRTVSDRWRTTDGWRVTVVRLSGTPDHHDGEWLRLGYHGFHVADVQQVADLARYVQLADLEAEGLVSAVLGSLSAESAYRNRPVDRGSGTRPGL
jgi:hypothetical protein